MAVTRLERKLKKDRAKAKRRKATIKRLNAQPPVKNIDIEAIKAEFEKNLKAPAPKKEESKAEVKEAKPKKESVEEVKAEVEVKEPKAKAEKKDESATKKKTESKKK